MAKTKKEEPVDIRAAAAPAPAPLGPHDRRADDQAIIGHFVEVTGGEHKGRYGVAIEVTSADKNGEPKTVVVRTRDAETDRLEVPYTDLAQSSSGRR